MKKNTIAGMGLLLASCASFAGCYTNDCSDAPDIVSLNGFYGAIGIGASGVDYNTTRFQENVLAPQLFATFNGTSNVTQGLGVLSLGFVKTYDNFYMGSEISIRGYTQKSHSVPLAKYGVDFVVKPGLIFGEMNTIIYPLLGVGMNNFRYGGVNSECFSGQLCGPYTYIRDRAFNKFYGYYLLGAGIKQPLSNGFALSVDVYYSGQENISYPGITYSPGLVIYNAHGYRITNNAVAGAVKLEYLFWA